MLLRTIAVQLIYRPSELASKLDNGNYSNFRVCSQLLKEGDCKGRETNSSVVLENEIYLVPVMTS